MQNLFSFVVIFLGSLTLLAGEVHADPGPMTCPDSPDSPVIVFKNKKGPTLLVCGQEDKRLSQGRKKHMTWLRIYKRSLDGLYSKPVLETTENDNYEAYTDSRGIVLDQFTLYGKTLIPTFRKTYRCKGSNCSFSGRICIFEVPKPNQELRKAHDEAVRTLESYSIGKNKGQFPDEALVKKVGEAALAGNRKAQELLLHQKYEVNIDGHSSEEFGRFFYLIKDLRELKCLPR